MAFSNFNIHVSRIREFYAFARLRSTEKEKNPESPWKSPREDRTQAQKSRKSRNAMGHWNMFGFSFGRMDHFGGLKTWPHSHLPNTNITAYHHSRLLDMG